MSHLLSVNARNRPCVSYFLSSWLAYEKKKRIVEILTKLMKKNTHDTNETEKHKNNALL